MYIFLERLIKPSITLTYDYLAYKSRIYYILIQKERSTDFDYIINLNQYIKRPFPLRVSMYI